MVEFLDDNLPDKQQVPLTQPNPNLPKGLSSQTKEVTPEMLDQMINNENEHPEIRAQAQKAKQKLLKNKKQAQIESSKETKQSKPKKSPQSQESTKKQKPSKRQKILQPEMEETQTSSPSNNDKPLTSVNASAQDFSNLLQNIQKDLYQEEISLLSDESVSVSLRSMSAEEYKFANKQLEIFESESENSTDSHMTQIRELTFTNSLDTLLQRCIVNDVNVLDLYLYDWIYLLVALRCISRPSDTKMRLSYLDENNERQVQEKSVNVPEFLNYLKTNKEQFNQIPLGTVSIHEDYSALLLPLTRRDLHVIESQMKLSSDASRNLLELSLCMKAFVKNKEAHMMVPEQRLKLFNQITDYDVLQEIQSVYSANHQKFFEVVNQYFREQFGKIEAIDISDFILFFLTF